MLSAILALLVLPFGDKSKTRGMQFNPLSKTTYFYFISNFIILGVLGAKHVEVPFIEIGQISTILYFTFFALIIPFSTLIENTFGKIGLPLPLPLPQLKKL
jgi:ubiquinol-cytochrome c reductase cytochrome b subunit